MDKEINNIIDELGFDENSSDESLPAGVLSHYELECLLVDYVLDRLEDSDRAKFEASMVYFPDIESEVKTTRDFFTNLEKFDYKALVRDKSQHLPDRVVASLERRHRLQPAYTPNKKRLVGFGIFAIILCGALYFNKDTTPSFPQVEEVAQSEIKHQSSSTLFTSLEQQMIADEMEDMNIVDLFEDNTYDITYLAATLYSDIEEVDAFYSQLYDDTDISLTLLSQPDYDYYMLLGWARGTEESLFQDLLDDMDNL